MKQYARYFSLIEPNQAIMLLALVAIAVRLIPLTRRSTDFAILPPDSIQYLELSDGLRHGCGFARLVNGVCASPEILRTPGYPLLLTAQPGIRSMLMIQSVMAGTLCLLLAYWVNQRWNLSAALLAEAIVAFDMPSITAANVILSDAFFQFILFLAVIPALLAATTKRYRRIAWLMASWVGMAAALAILTKPIALILPVALLLPFLLSTHLSHRARIASAAVAFAIPIAVTFTWITRNYVMTKYFGLSTVSAINLCFYRAAAVIARVKGTRFEQAQRELVAKFGLILPQVYEAKTQSAQFARRMTILGQQILLAHPHETFLMTLKAILYIAVVPDRSGLAWVLGLPGGYPQPHVGLATRPLSLGLIGVEVRHTLQSPVLMFLLIFQIALIGFVWLGVIRGLLRSKHTGADYRMWIRYLTAIAMLFIALAGGAEATVRFRVPIVPLLAVVTGLGYFPAAATASRQDIPDEQDSVRAASEM
jgi:Dolichyl-phosphate-mannose-protein mannosyltransferase